MEDGLNVAGDAAQSLAGVSGRSGQPRRVTEDLAGRALQMREASTRVTAHMSNASAAVERNASAAAEMRSTTNHVTTMMVPISVFPRQAPPGKPFPESPGATSATA
jgi:hypothetical protein